MQHLFERRLESTEVFRGRLLHAFKDSVELHGGACATREYVLHPGAVMVVPLLDGPLGQTEVVLERQFRYPIQQVVIEFPAGKVDPGEASLACAMRELREETGYLAEQWAYAGCLHPIVAYSTERIDIWFARGLTLGERALDEGESLDVFTATLSELLNWCRNGSVIDAKTLTATLWLQNVLSGGWTLEWSRPPAMSAARSP